jgi:hypothetical protein
VAALDQGNDTIRHTGLLGDVSLAETASHTYCAEGGPDPVICHHHRIKGASYRAIARDLAGA